jgi:hypothetical protein
MTGVLQAAIHGMNKCAVVRHPGGVAGSGTVACWGARAGEALGPDTCNPSQPTATCWMAKPAQAPAF